MAETRQYVACTFKAGDARSYTYHNDGAPLAVGDVAKVEDHRGGGWKRVYVVAIDVEKPTKFDTKPILGKAEPEPLDALDLGEDRNFDPSRV